jgi:extracellular elastinolytic metalloproteinase
LLVPGAAVAVVQIADEAAQAAEFDSRTGKLAPTHAQRAAVKQLKAAVTWNRFGSPASLTRREKFLATGIGGRDSAEAARNWLEANRALLGLRSTADLRLESDSPLRGSRGHAVNFRQIFEGSGRARAASSPSA